jgi:hypothetical protein
MTSLNCLACQNPLAKVGEKEAISEVPGPFRILIFQFNEYGKKQGS